MIVIFVSQCEKNALKKTRMVLDAFADRIGDNTWRTVITMEGLQAVKQQLRKTASKNTAVSCHWIRSRSRSDLMWIVGSKQKFNAQGLVPVNSTKNDLLKLDWQGDWQYLPVIKVLAALAGLFHDFGKASEFFQKKLLEGKKISDPIRHEWVSCVLFRSLIASAGDLKSDESWLSYLAKAEFNEEDIINNEKYYEDNPFAEIPKAARMIEWLILSHHRLPVNFNKDDWLGEKADDIKTLLGYIKKEWGYENKKIKQQQSECFKFTKGFCLKSASWLKQVKKWAVRFCDILPLLEQSFEDGSWRQIIHHARLCLMLGDYYFSSQPNDFGDKPSQKLYANTDKKTGKLKQKYDEHLIGVTKNALNIAHRLPLFEKELPLLSNISSFKQASQQDFEWQDKAVKKIIEWKIKNKEISGFFAVNMASTGCGKTFANAKIMNALSEEQNNLRYILALGLRTLTLQTGDEYRDRIGLDNTELAVLIGSKAIQELHNQDKGDNSDDEGLNSESEESLLDEDVDFDCAITDEWLSTILINERDKKFLYAPILVCTIDHIMGAVETKRGGKYMLPVLRLMSSDLVIDEIDDFNGSDLIAIGRLIHFAGMMGSKVTISSATISPDLAEGYFNAYRAGWKIYAAARNKNTSVGCAWIDEFNAEVISVSMKEADMANEFYRTNHAKFVSKRVENLKYQSIRRKADIKFCADILENREINSEETIQQKYFGKIKEAVIEKHCAHAIVDNKTGIAVSFGVIRMANIKPCVKLTEYLLKDSELPKDVEIRVMAYHSQQVLLLRHEQEKHLDAVLKRKGDHSEQLAFNNPVIRNHLNNCGAKNLLFILVATPVEEIGRDHDFDWAVIEPSSYRSIIQLAGRVRRHRKGGIEKPNIALMQYNWEGIKNFHNQKIRCFYRPGYEESFAFATHDLAKLINTDIVRERVDAIPRIQKPAKPDYKNSLIDLEHYVIHLQLTKYDSSGANSLQGYLDEVWHLTAMPQLMKPFRVGEPSKNLWLYFDKGKDSLYFAERDQNDEWVRRGEIYKIEMKKTDLEDDALKRLWLNRDYLKSLEEYSQKNEISKQEASSKYGRISFIYFEPYEYEYRDQFGIVAKDRTKEKTNR